MVQSNLIREDGESHHVTVGERQGSQQSHELDKLRDKLKHLDKDHDNTVAEKVLLQAKLTTLGDIVKASFADFILIKESLNVLAPEGSRDPSQVKCCNAMLNIVNGLESRLAKELWKQAM